MKKICALFLVLCCMMPYFAGTVSAAEAVDDTAVYSGCTTLDASQPLLGTEQLVQNADSIILYETSSETLMYAWNADQKVDPASLVKIMTGFIVAEQGAMDDAVTVTQDVLSSVSADALTVGLMPDEILTVEQLMYCMLVASANDAAAVLADHVSGSQTAFVEEMNAVAQELGCTQTHFANVHGLHDPNQYSTARDLARILDAALENETFREIFGTVYYTIPQTNKALQRDLVTGNYHLCADEQENYRDKRVIGGRTGVTGDGKRSLATVATDGNMELLCILLGSESEIDENGYSVRVYGGYHETSDILDHGFDGLKLTQVIRADQVLTQKSVAGGECDVVLGTLDSVFAIMPDTLTSDDLTLKLIQGDNLTAPIKKGDILSEVEIWYGNLCIATTQVYAMNSVDLLQDQTQQKAPTAGSSGLKDFWIILIVIIAVVLLAVFLRSGAWRRRRRAASRNNAYRKARRRSR